MTKEEFYNKIIISDEEKEKSKYYFRYRGISEHIVVYDYLKSLNLNRIKYSQIASVFRYDKRIRTVIYKYIGFLEEYLRAIISNLYQKDLPESIITKAYYKHQSSKFTYNNLVSLSFSQLIEVFNRLPKEIISESFNERYDKKLIKNIIQLRNAISHNRFILDYFNKESLLFNIENLQKLLPVFLKDDFAIEINNCAKEKQNKNDHQTIWDLPKETIIHLAY